MKGYCVVMRVLLVLSFIAHGIVAATIEGKLTIPGDPLAVSNIKISLNGDQRTTLTRRDGAFSFFNVSPGIYLLDVLSVEHIYSQFKIKVTDDNSVIPVEYKYPGSPRSQTPYPIVLTPLAKYNYFQVKEGFSLYRTLFKNPMMIMMVVSLGVIMFFPKLMSGMDKDQMKEIMEQQKQAGMDGGDPTAALKKMFGMETKEIDIDDD